MFITWLTIFAFCLIPVLHGTKLWANSTECHRYPQYSYNVVALFSSPTHRGHISQTRTPTDGKLMLNATGASYRRWQKRHSVKVLDIRILYTSQTHDQKRFTISKWQLVPQRNMRPSVTRTSKRLDSRCIHSTYHRPNQPSHCSP